MALGEDARANSDGFKFDKEKKEWSVTFGDIIDYTIGVTDEDIDEDFVMALLLDSINNGNELIPDSRSNGGRRIRRREALRTMRQLWMRAS